MSQERGSEKLLAAWKARALSEEGVNEIAAGLDNSPATVRSVDFHGGDEPTGVSLSLVYEGEDGPKCGTDIAMWLRWQLRFGGNPRPPKIIINGIPYPDWLRLDLNFGHPPPERRGGVGDAQLGELG